MTVKDQKFTQCLHNIRDASGRFQKVEAIEIRKETKIKMLHEGFKKWNAKRKLQYNIISKENKPPAKQMTRVLEVSTVKPRFSRQSRVQIIEKINLNEEQN